MDDKDLRPREMLTKRMAVRIAVLILAAIFLVFAKIYDDRKAEKQAAQEIEISKAEQAAAEIAAEMGDQTGLPVGEKPDFTVYTADEQQLRLSSFRGKPTVLFLWATWSTPCQQMMPAFDSLREKYGERINFVTVDLTDGQEDTVESVTSFMQQGGFGFPVYFDIGHEAEIICKVLSLPVLLYLDADGAVVECCTELQTAEQMEASLANLL